MRLREVPLNLSFAQTFAERTPEAYERLLLDVIRGNQTLFMRRDELEAAWEVGRPDPRMAGTCSSDAPQTYTAGTWGPAVPSR
jgi:glucose-6-phosphate 1-dehydrogenase